ncbi:MAG TPA: hypothetical protein VIF62_07310 [Labilithrix sp.]|jgi:hypothetical protein
MLLDNLFFLIGGPGTTAIMLGIVAFVGIPAMSAVVCPSCALHRRLARGR